MAAAPAAAAAAAAPAGETQPRQRSTGPAPRSAAHETLKWGCSATHDRHDRCDAWLAALRSPSGLQKSCGAAGACKDRQTTSPCSSQPMVPPVATSALPPHQQRGRRVAASRSSSCDPGRRFCELAAREHASIGTEQRSRRAVASRRWAPGRQMQAARPQVAHPVGSGGVGAVRVLRLRLQVHLCGGPEGVAGTGPGMSWRALWHHCCRRRAWNRRRLCPCSPHVPAASSAWPARLRGSCAVPRHPAPSCGRAAAWGAGGGGGGGSSRRVERAATPGRRDRRAGNAPSDSRKAAARCSHPAVVRSIAAPAPAAEPSLLPLPELHLVACAVAAQKVAQVAAHHQAVRLRILPSKRMHGQAGGGLMSAGRPPGAAAPWQAVLQRHLLPSRTPCLPYLPAQPLIHAPSQCQCGRPQAG